MGPGRAGSGYVYGHGAGSRRLGLRLRAWGRVAQARATFTGMGPGRAGSGYVYGQPEARPPGTTGDHGTARLGRPTRHAGMHGRA
jgi:hypothetical protein